MMHIRGVSRKVLAPNPVDMHPIQHKCAYTQAQWRLNP